MSVVETFPLQGSQHEQESRGAEERFQHLQDSLTVVRVVSNLVGNELGISTMSDPEQVGDPGVYWFEAPTSEAPVSGARFEYRPRNLSGAADSAHSVIPGLLAINRTGESDKNFEIVAKCYTTREFEDRLERAKNEVRVMNVMKQSGELTIKPLAIAITPFAGRTNGEIVLISEYDPSLITLDNLPWADGLTESNVANMVLAVGALGRFNRLGMQHGDAKIKNVAQNVSGQVSMIDFETAKPIDLSDPAAVMTTVHSDLELFMRSLQRKGLFGTEEKPLPTLEILDAVNVLIDTYLESWGEISDERVIDSIIVGMQSAVESVLPNLQTNRGLYIRSQQD
jgi:hypothetical protein